jgi:DNA-binding transcriptional regulator YhcF (GntR family)
VKIIDVKNNQGIPKYKQIINSIEKMIENGQLKMDQKLPSINKVCIEFSLSRDTVLLAYANLKKRGIIYAILGKGYYIKSTEIKFKERIFLLFDELNSFKEDLYNSFLLHLGKEVEVDIYFHNFNIKVFEKLINDSNNNYTKYIIMPTNLVGAATIIKTLPVKNTYILDQTNKDLMTFPGVCQNHLTDIYNCLVKCQSRLIKYKKIILLFSEFKEPEALKIGFEIFCEDYKFNYEIITSFYNCTILEGDVFIIPSDRDLVKVIEKGKSQLLTIGKNYGIISYNETPLKKLVENGITTISTNFEAMGERLAKMIRSGEKEQIQNESDIIIRNSL